MRLRTFTPSHCWAGMAGLHLIACAPAEPSSEVEIVGTDTQEEMFWVSNLEAGEVVAFSTESGERLGQVVDPTTLPVSLRPFRPSSAVQNGPEVYVTQYSTGEVLAFAAETGVFERVVFENQASASAPRVEEPCMIRVFDHHTWVLGNDTRNLLILDESGAVVDEVGRSPLHLRNPHGFDVTPDGLLYVAMSPTHPGNGLIEIWDLNVGRPVGEFAPYGEIEEGTGLMVAEDRTLVVSDWFGNQVVRYDAHTGEKIGTILEGSHGLDRPVATATSEAGSLLVLDAMGVLVHSTSGVERLVDASDENLQWARGITVPSF